MSSSTATATVSSPRSPTASTFKNPRAAPSSQRSTAILWDRYEKEAVENVRRRERTHNAPKRQHCSESDIDHERIKQPSVTIATAARISFDFNFGDTATSPPSSPIAFCKSCKQSVPYASGTCERCQKTTTLPSPTGVLTPPVSPTTPNFSWSDLPQKRAASSSSSTSYSPRSTSFPRASFSPFPQTYLVDPPARHSSFWPPPSRDSSTTQNNPTNRKPSLTDPNEPFLRFQVAHAHPMPKTPRSLPSSPSFPPTNTRPSTSHSHKNAYQFGLENYVFTPHRTIAPSQLSPTRPYTATTMSSLPGSHRLSNAPRNIFSAWDDWNSDEEEEEGEEQVRLVSWKSVRSARKSRESHREKEKEKEREREKEQREREAALSFLMDSPEKEKEKKASSETMAEGKEEGKREEKVKMNRGKRKDRQEGKRSGERKKPGGFVRLVSCGC